MLQTSTSQFSASTLIYSGCSYSETLHLALRQYVRITESSSEDVLVCLLEISLKQCSPAAGAMGLIGFVAGSTVAGVGLACTIAQCIAHEVRMSSAKTVEPSGEELEKAGLTSDENNHADLSEVRI